MDNLDLLADKVNLFYMGNKKFKSKLGGILSIIFYISAIISFLCYFIDFFKQNEWYSLNKITITDPQGWSPFEIKILHKSLKSEESLHELYYQINEGNKIFLNSNLTCSDSQLKEMEMNPDTDYNFFCFKIDQFLSHSIKKRCYHLKAALLKTDCFSSERNITVRVLSYFLDTEKMAGPIKKFHDVNEIYGRKNQMFVTHNKLVDDKNYFFESQEVSYFSEIWFQEDMYSMWDSGVYTISPLVDIIPLQQLLIERKTLKFNDVLAKSNAIIQLIYLIFLGFYRYIFIDYYFNKKQLIWFLENSDEFNELNFSMNKLKINSSQIGK